MQVSRQDLRIHKIGPGAIQLATTQHRTASFASSIRKDDASSSSGMTEKENK